MIHSGISNVKKILVQGRKPASHTILAAAALLLPLMIFGILENGNWNDLIAVVPRVIIKTGCILIAVLMIYASQFLKANVGKANCGLAIPPATANRPKSLGGRIAGLFQTNSPGQQPNESEECDRRLIDLLPDAIFLQVGGQIVLINPAAVRLFGASCETDLLGTSIVDRLHPDHRNLVIERIESLKSSQTSVPATRGVFLRMDGSSVSVDVSASAITFEGKKGAIVLARDVTTQIESEYLLERYQALSQNVRDIIWFVRFSDGQILETNQAAEKAYGYSREEFRAIKIKDLRANQTLSLLESQFHQADQEGITFETIHVKKNGEQFPVEVSSKTFLTRGEKVLMSVIRDISERKQIDEQIRKQMAEKSQRAQELEAIIDVFNAMRNISTRAQMVSVLVEQAMRVTRSHGGALLLLKENKLIVQFASGDYSEFVGRRITNQENILWDIFRSGQIKVYQRGSSSLQPAYGSLLPDFQHELDVVTYAPLMAGPVTIGLLIIGFREEEKVPENQVRLISAIAEMAGSALHRMSTSETMEKIVTARTRELEYIYQISSTASAATEMHRALQQAIDQTLQAIGADAGAIYLLNEDNLTLRLAAEKSCTVSIFEKKVALPIEGSIPGWVVQHREPLILPNLTDDPRSKMFIRPGAEYSFAGLPMRVRGRVVGMLGVSKTNREQFNLEEMMLLSFIADHIGLVVDHFHLYQQAGKSAISEERSRMARELHDSVTQSLYSASLFSAGAIKFIDANKIDQVKDYLIQLGQVTQQALKDMRLMVYELRSPDLFSGGLAGALQIRLDTVERRSGIKTKLRFYPLPALSEQLEQDLFRIALEALNNTLKHSQANEVDIEIRYLDGNISLSVRDNGYGFNPSVANSGVGLASMRERASRWNGRFNIFSEENAGCVVMVSIPITEG